LSANKYVSEEIRERAHANGYALSSKTESLLSNYDYNAQKRWVTNPIIERIIENVKWQILQNRGGDGASHNNTISVSNNNNNNNDKKQEISSKKKVIVEKKEDSDSDSDDVIGGFNLFD